MKKPYMKIFLVSVLPVTRIIIASDFTNQEMWVPDGRVKSVAVEGNTVYIGGEFSYIGPETGGWVPVSTANAAVISEIPMVDGFVAAVCEDGNGGWFIGGNFTSVDGVPRTNPAHILPDERLDPEWKVNWTYGKYKNVYRLVAEDGILFVGGFFDSYGGVGREKIAAINATTGKPTEWNPPTDGVVNTIVVNGSTIYAGGLFRQTHYLGFRWVDQVSVYAIHRC